MATVKGATSAEYAAGAEFTMPSADTVLYAVWAVDDSNKPGPGPDQPDNPDNPGTDEPGDNPNSPGDNNGNNGRDNGDVDGDKRGHATDGSDAFDGSDGRSHWGEPGWHYGWHQDANGNWVYGWYYDGKGSGVLPKTGDDTTLNTAFAFTAVLMSISLLSLMILLVVAKRHRKQDAACNQGSKVA